MLVGAGDSGLVLAWCSRYPAGLTILPPPPKPAVGEKGAPPANLECSSVTPIFQQWFILTLCPSEPKRNLGEEWGWGTGA